MMMNLITVIIMVMMVEMSDGDGGGTADVYSGGCNSVRLLEMMMPTYLSTTFFSFVQTCSTWWKNS